MLSGRRLDLLDPSPLDIEIEDIAHGLAFVARWNGQTRGEHPYSVAEHSLLVERSIGRLGRDAEPRWRLAALLHDAPEYVIGDMISPVKSAVGPGLCGARRPAGGGGAPALRPAGGTARPGQGAIKRADRISAWLEAVQIAGFSVAEADRFFGAPRVEGLRALCCSCAHPPRSRRLPRPPRGAIGGVLRACNRGLHACNSAYASNSEPDS